MRKFYLLFTVIIIYSSSTAQWNPNTLANLEVAGLKSADIQAVATSDGRTYIAYYQQNGGNYDMRAQLLNAQGVKQFGNDGLLVSSYTSGSATFVFNAAVDNQNNLLIAFQDQRSGSNGALIHKISPEGGLVWGAPGIVLGAGLSPYPAVLSNNDVIVAWNNSSNRISVERISAAGTVVWGPLEILPPTAGRSISRCQVVSHSNNTYGIVFQQRTGTSGNPTPTNLYEQRFDANGTALWAAPVQISNYVTSNARYFSVMADADTTFVGYYANPAAQSRFDAFLQRVNADGTMPWGINGSSFSTEQVNYEMTTTLAYNPGAAQVWELCTFTTPSQTQYGIYVQKFNKSDGARLLTDNARIVYPISANNEQQLGGLSLFGDDPVFAFYDATAKLYASRLNSNGDFVWAPQKTELATTANTKFRYSFTKAINNQAVAVWQENKGVEDRPYAQNISSDGGTGTIPVKLGNFYGQLNGSTAKLFWETYTEVNNKGFYVERSVDGTAFTALGFVAGKSPAGSNLLLKYDFTDPAVSNGNNFYRLKQIDLDGRSAYSPVILLKSRGRHELIVYPNPATTSVSFRPGAKPNEQFRYSITNAAGSILMERSFTQKQYEETVKIDIGHLPAGAYHLQLMNVKTKQMQLGSFLKE